MLCYVNKEVNIIFCGIVYARTMKRYMHPTHLLHNIASAYHWTLDTSSAPRNNLGQDSGRRGLWWFRMAMSLIHFIQLKNSVASFIEKYFQLWALSLIGKDEPFVFETSLRGISVSEVFHPRQFWKFCASHSFQIHFRPSVCIASSICCLKSPRSVFSLYTNWPRLREYSVEKIKQQIVFD